VVGDLLYGRGACDMKGGLATIVGALEALKVLGVSLRGDVTVAATVGEEDTEVGKPICTNTLPVRRTHCFRGTANMNPMLAYLARSCNSYVIPTRLLWPCPRSEPLH